MLDTPRPSTGDSLDADHRPFTSADVGCQPSPGADEELVRSQLTTVQSLISPSEEIERSAHQNQELLSPHSEQVNNLDSFPLSTGSLLQLCLIENWGDPSSIGLTGIQLLDVWGRKIELKSDQICGGQGSDVMVERLLDNVNLSSEPDHMWTTPFHPSQPHTPTTLIVSLDTPTQLTGLRVWNYNASLEDSYRGVSYSIMFVCFVCYVFNQRFCTW